MPDALVQFQQPAPGLGSEVYGATIEKGELEIEGGYLFAVGEAQDETDGQFRLLVELDF